jgi:hypothetical protein
MHRKGLTWPDILLAMLLVVGVTFTVVGGLSALHDPTDLRAENAFVIGVGMLLPLLAILGLRLLPAKPRHR